MTGAQMRKIHIIDRTEQPPAIGDAEWFKHREESKPKCTGLSVLARRHCATWGICGNCRLCSHRLQRCAYFERCVLPGMDAGDAEHYATKLDVALEGIGCKRRRVASWDRLSDGEEKAHSV